LNFSEPKNEAGTVKDAVRKKNDKKQEGETAFAYVMLSHFLDATTNIFRKYYH
jgi:hypothetical protein